MFAGFGMYKSAHILGSGTFVYSFEICSAAAIARPHQDPAGIEFISFDFIAAESAENRVNVL